MPDETGWLLEKQDKGANWFIGVINGMLEWTTDPNKALRLARRDDAEAIATICEDAEKISEHLWPDMTTPNCHRCGRPCVQGNQGSWMCDCTSTPFDCRRHSVQEAFTMIGMLRSFIACGESTTKDDDAAIASILDKLRIAGAQPLPVVSPPPNWSQIQLGLPLEQQNYLDDLAHGLVTKGALAWVCGLVNKASGGAVSSEPAWKCKANPTADPPLDCDWPFCGCDPLADKVIEAIQESGFSIVKDEDLLRGAVSPEPQEKK